MSTATSSQPQFFCTSANADGIKFYTRRPPVAPAPAAPAAASSESESSSDEAQQQQQQQHAKVLRLSHEEQFLKQLERTEQTQKEMAELFAKSKAEHVRLRSLHKTYKAQHDKKLRALEESKAARKRRAQERNGGGADRLSPKSGLMLYCFVDDKLAKFLGIDEKTCVLRHDITSHYANYVTRNGLKTLVQVEGKKKPVTRTQLDDNLRELLGPENVAKIESGEVVLTPIVFNKMVQVHYRGHAPAPTEEQSQEIAAFRG